MCPLSTFCMGADLESILGSPIDQPMAMAQVFYNSFGQKGALTLWSLIISAQCVLPTSVYLRALNNEQIHDGIELSPRRFAPDVRIRS
jgi:hypothetical protein